MCNWDRNLLVHAKDLFKDFRGGIIEIWESVEQMRRFCRKLLLQFDALTGWKDEFLSVAFFLPLENLQRWNWTNFFYKILWNILLFFPKSNFRVIMSDFSTFDIFFSLSSYSVVMSWMSEIHNTVGLWVAEHQQESSLRICFVLRYLLLGLVSTVCTLHPLCEMWNSICCRNYYWKISLLTLSNLKSCEKNKKMDCFKV